MSGETPTQLEFTQAMTDFKIMFPDMEVDVIEAVLRSNNGAVDTTIDQLLAMSADNDTSAATGGTDNSPPPAYGQSLPSYGEAVQGEGGYDSSSNQVLGACSSLGPDLLASLGASGGGAVGSPLHTQKGWRPPMLGRLPQDFLRLGVKSSSSKGASHSLGHAYTHPERQPTHHGKESVVKQRSGEGGGGERVSSQITEDERFALMLQNEEFMTELRGNTEFLSALEEERREGECNSAPTPRKSHLGMDDAAFREKLRTMGKSSKAKFTRLATMFSRRGGGASKLLGHAPAPSKDNLLLNAEPLVNCRDSEEESEGEGERHSTTKGRKYQLM